MTRNGLGHLLRLGRKFDADGGPARRFTVDAIKGIDWEVGEHATVNPGHSPTVEVLLGRGITGPWDCDVGGIGPDGDRLEEERDRHRGPHSSSDFLVIGREPVVVEVPWNSA